jgi:hypothetical protein
MSGFALGERVKLSITLALTTDATDALHLREQEKDARRLGMSGADIDAARRGWSFDVQTSIALNLAMAAASRNKAARAKQRKRAVLAGIDETVCDGIERLAADIADASSVKARRRD